MFLRDSGCTGKVTSYNEFTVYYSDCIELNLYVIIIIDLMLLLILNTKHIVTFCHSNIKIAKYYTMMVQ